MTDADWLAWLSGPACRGAYLTSGGPPAFLRSGRERAARFRALGLWREGDAVLDVGCGPGRHAIPLLGLVRDYLGLDSHGPLMAACRQRYAPWPAFRFEHVPGAEPEAATFPAGGGAFDAAILSSVLTHLGTADACRRYLAETRRCLRPGGRAWVTWFRSPPNAAHAGRDRTVLREADILRMLAGWDVLHTEGGTTTGHHDQWEMLLCKP